MQEIFEISHNGSHCVAESVNFHKTGDFSVMNLGSSSFDPIKQQTLIAVGQNEKTQTYALQLVRERKISVSVDDDNEDGLRRRRQSSSNGNDAEFAPQAGITNTSSLVFNVRPLKAVQTDYKYVRRPLKVVLLTCFSLKYARTISKGGKDCA